MISTTASLDRESNASYQFKVLASSQRDASMSNTAEVVVEVIDIDDNPPMLLYPSADNDTLHVSIDTPPHHRVTRIQAIDVDSTAQFNELSYEMRLMAVYKQAQQLNHIRRILNESETHKHDRNLSSNDSNISQLRSFEHSIDEQTFQLFNLDSTSGWVKTHSALKDYPDFVFCFEVSIFNTIYSSIFSTSQFRESNNSSNDSFLTKPTLIPKGLKHAIKRSAPFFVIINSSLEMQATYYVRKVHDWKGWKGKVGRFGDLGELLFYFAAAVGGGCLVVLCVVVVAVMVVRRKGKRRGAERLRKLNGNMALIDCLTNNGAFDAKDLSTDTQNHSLPPQPHTTDHYHTDRSHTDHSHTDHSCTDHSHTDHSHSDHSHTDHSHCDNHSFFDAKDDTSIDLSKSHSRAVMSSRSCDSFKQSRDDATEMQFVVGFYIL